MILELSAKVKDSYSQVNLLNFEDIPVLRNENPHVNVPQASSNPRVDPLPQRPIFEKDELSIFKKESANKEKDANVPEEKPSIVGRNFFTENQVRYDLMIGIKQKSDILYLFNSNKQVKTLKLENSFFNDQSNTFTLYPDNCRYVNLGFSVLITGGYINKNVTSNCYLVMVTQKSDSSYDQSILPYANMIEARERHNIINLPNRNQILVCSGFFNNNAEITSMNNPSWKQLPKMNEVRANATLSYVNKRLVYCLGGFKINNKTGIYHNSAEFLDLDNLGNGWKNIDFSNLNKHIKMSAMGIIDLGEKLLLCGGYDGSLYREDVSSIEFEEDGKIKSYQNFNAKLPGSYIFLHNGFVRMQNCSYNYDLAMNVICYEPNTSSFSLVK